jgi:uncharacterized membrane protein YphA (DoxX/SURF4 family)
MLDAHVKTSWWTLRLCYGLVPIVAGFDKFTNLLTNWTKYLSPTIQQMLPASMSATSFMYWIGVIEIAAGLMVLSNYVRWGAYVVSLWLVAVAVNLLSTGQYFDIAVRDTVMAVGAFALAKLTEGGAGAREGAMSTRQARSPLHPARIGA